MKKVLFFKPRVNVIEGGLRVTINVCNSLSNFFDVYLVNLFEEKCVFDISSNVKQYGILKNEVRMRYAIFRVLINFRKYVKANNIELIISETRQFLFLVYIVTIGLNVKILYHNHFSILEFLNLQKNNKSLKEKVLNMINSFIEKKMAGIIVLTESDKQTYVNLGVKKEKLSKIYNWIDEKLLKNTLREYSINSKQIIIVGRIDYQKGYEYLVEVAKLVFEKHHDWQWHIYGDGEAEYKNKIIDLIKQNNLQNHIILQGNHSDIYYLYQDYSFYVMTSRYEGLPMVLLEAKAKKLPIVSFDINSGPSDIVRDGIDGFLIEPFDCNAMADKICELIENPEIRQKFSDNAHGNIDKFRKEKIIKQWCDLIENI